MYQPKTLFMMFLGNVTAIFIVSYLRDDSLTRIVGAILIAMLVYVTFSVFLAPPKQ